MSLEWKFYNLAEKRTLDAWEIIREKILTCAFCRGCGDIGGGICPVCSGKGKKAVHPPLICCCRCKGWGSYPMNSQSPCMVCKGMGAVSVRLPIMTCPTCLGRGDTTSGLICTKCGGKGVITGSGTSAGSAHTSVLSHQTILIKKIISSRK